MYLEGSGHPREERVDLTHTVIGEDYGRRNTVTYANASSSSSFSTRTIVNPKLALPESGVR